MSKCEHGLTSKECYVCASPKYGDHAGTVERTLTDEVIANLWHQNAGYHHHFARAIERWLKGQA
jgi:hypothetical protein